MEKTVFISMPIEELQTVIIDCVNACLKHNPCPHGNQVKQEHENDLMRLPDLCEKLGCTPSNVYALTSTNRIPFMKMRKTLFFSRTEIDAWIKSGRRKTVDELAAEVKTQASEMPKRPTIGRPSVYVPIPRPSVFVPEESANSEEISSGTGPFRLFPSTPPINKRQGPK